MFSRFPTQPHFTFYLQFFIEKWNEMQQENMRKKNYNRTLGNLDTHPLQEKDYLCEFMNNMALEMLAIKTLIFA